MIYIIVGQFYFSIVLFFLGGGGWVGGIIHSLFNIIIYRFGQFQTFCGATMNYTLFFGPYTLFSANIHVHV